MVDRIFRFLMNNMEIVVIFFFLLGPILSAITRSAQNKKRPPTSRPRTGEPPTDLEDRVRRNFEEFVRKKLEGSGKPDDTPAETLPAPKPEPIVTAPEPPRAPQPAPPAPKVPAARVPATGVLAPMPGLKEILPELSAADIQIANVIKQQEQAYRRLDDAVYDLPTGIHRDAYLIRAGHRQKNARRLVSRSLSKDDLRRAVVFREILDRPVSLRNRSAWW